MHVHVRVCLLACLQPYAVNFKLAHINISQRLNVLGYFRAQPTVGEGLLPILMVPHLHQSNGYIKRKVRVWRAQKCNALVGAETVLTSAGPQITQLHGGQQRARMKICRNSTRTGKGTPLKTSIFKHLLKKITAPSI